MSPYSNYNFKNVISLELFFVTILMDETKHPDKWHFAGNKGVCALGNRMTIIELLRLITLFWRIWMLRDQRPWKNQNINLRVKDLEMVVLRYFNLQEYQLFSSTTKQIVESRVPSERSLKFLLYSWKYFKVSTQIISKPSYVQNVKKM